MASWRARVEELLAPDTGDTPAERLADPPVATSGAAGVVMVAAATGALGVAVVGRVPTGMPLSTPGALVALGALIALGGAAVGLRSTPAAHVAWLSAFIVLAHGLPGAGEHPFPMVMALAGYAAVVMWRRELRQSVGWLHTGSVGPQARRQGVHLAVLAGLVLLLWFGLASPALQEPRATLAQVPVPALPVIGVFFVLVNAGAEELVFRGVLLDGLRSAFGDVAGVVLQAIAFGAVHVVVGIPDGVIGGVLAGGYGLLLGALRLRTGGMVTVWLVHASTDLVIFLLIVLSLG